MASLCENNTLRNQLLAGYENNWERAPNFRSFHVTLKNKIKLHNMVNSRPKCKP